MRSMNATRRDRSSQERRDRKEKSVEGVRSQQIQEVNPVQVTEWRSSRMKNQPAAFDELVERRRHSDDRRWYGSAHN